MIEFAAITYGVLASFVISSAGRNRATSKPHPPVLRHVGYVLCGMSAGTCAILTGVAVSQLI